MSSPAVTATAPTVQVNGTSVPAQRAAEVTRQGDDVAHGGFGIYAYGDDSRLDDWDLT
jgi:hypothetical protein